MAISKVIYKSSASATPVTWIDATPATAAAADIISPKTAMLADGVVTQGTGSGGVAPTGNINITQSGVTDVTNYATATVPTANFFTDVADRGFKTENNQRFWTIKGMTEVDLGEGDTEGWISSGMYYGQERDYNAVPANTTITPSTSAQTVGGAKYMMEGAVTVAAMPSGTAGTPTATKGTVSNHSVSVTPSVTNTTGYITGSTKTGTAVTVQASELVSGTLTVDSSGTKDVTNYASASVPAMTLPSASSGSSAGTSKATIARSTSAQYINIPTGFNDTAQYYTISAVPNGTEGTPTASRGAVSNHSVTVTPSVTNSAGYITGSTKTGTAVTVSASELVSGSETKTANGTYNVTNLASLVVAVPIVTYYTGSSSPSAALGSNGDIYLQTGS